MVVDSADQGLHAQNREEAGAVDLAVACDEVVDSVVEVLHVQDLHAAVREEACHANPLEAFWEEKEAARKANQA